MISHLNFAEGVEMPRNPENMNEVLASLLFSHMRDVVTLQPGVYDLTPKLWTGNTHIHEVTVFDTGEGVYRLHPKNDQSGTVETGANGRLGYTAGGRQVDLNAEQPLAVIGGGHPTKLDLQIYSLVIFSQTSLDA